MSRSSRPRAHPTVRVLVAHRHRAFAEALRIALSQTPGLRITGVAHDASELLGAARDHPADVVLLDEGIRSAETLGTGWEIKDTARAARVLMLTETEDPLVVARAAEAGADAVLARSRPLRDVVRSVQAVARGQPLIDPEIVRRALLRVRKRREENAALAERLDRLTSREVEILQHLADGLPSEEIAHALGISPHTLRTHVQNVLMKLRVHSKLEAVTAAIRHGRVRVRADAVVEVERRLVDLTPSESRGGAYAGDTTGSTSGDRSGRGRSRGSSR